MHLELTRMKASGAVALAFLAVAALGGCGSSGMKTATGPTLGPAELGLPEGACAATGYVILERERLVGRFPAALAVVKLREASGKDASRGWQAATLKEEQAVWWNSLFNTAPAIREVLVMSERTPGPPGAGVSGLTAKARRLDARLCLVYGPAATGPQEAALIGALLDTHSGRAIARIQAQATSVDFQARRADAPSGDRRHVDPQYLVDRKFQQQVRLCVDELIGRNSLLAPPGATAPETAPSPESP
jgi:hypothetical protein